LSDYSETTLSARLYGTAKIHKPGVPLRPIVSYVGSPCYNIASLLSSILEPLRRKEHEIQNVYDLKRKVEDLTIDVDEELVSYDVVSLFPSVPRKKVVEIIKQKLHDDKSLGGRTKLNEDEILDLLCFVLDATAFRYDGDYYEQLTGVPMGSPVSVVVAEILMEDLETKALSKDIKPSWYGRFVDDIVSKIKANNIPLFHQNLNSICPEIQFTVEMSKGGALPFLDGKIIRTGSRLSLEVYSKPTYTDRYLQFTSNNPIDHKRAVVSTLLHRALTVPTEPNEKNTEVNRVKKALVKNGYPTKFIRNELSKAVRERDVGRKEGTSQQSKPLGFACVPYVKHVSDKIRRVLSKAGIRVAHPSTNTLRQKLDRLKDPITQDDERGVVYCVPCRDCNQVYIGQTSVARKTRMKQHEADCRYKRAQKSELVEHHLRTGHSFSFDDVTTLYRERNYRRRVWKESWAIESNASAVNRKTEVTLPPQYLQFLKT
jgi:hypothetical protein